MHDFIPTPQPFDLVRSSQTCSPTPQSLPPSKRFCSNSRSFPSPVSLHAPQVQPPLHPSDRGPPPLDKFTKSRAVGQSHRDNEKEHVRHLILTIEHSRRENLLLFALFASRYKSALGLPVPPCVHPPQHPLWLLPGDLAEDHDVLSDAHAAQRGLHKLSHDTAERLGQRYVSTTVAAALLEFMVFRRNLVPDMAGVPAPCVSVEGRRRRRRRSTYRMATSKIMAEEIVTFAVRMFAQEPRGDEDLISYVDRRLGSLGVAMARWHDMEARFNPEKVLEEKASDDGDDEDDIVMNANNGSEFAPMSPTRPEMAEFGGGGTRRRGEGAKRCSRCNRVKFTGSGHGRSKCDDGYSISSLVPYPASPREDGQGSN